MIDDIKRPEAPQSRPAKLDTIQPAEPAVNPPIKTEVEEPNFVPPEEVSNGPVDEPAEEQAAPAEKKRFSLKNLSKKQKIILIVVVLIVVLGGSASAYVVMHKPKPKPKAAVVQKVAPPAPKPKPIVSPLTGLPVSLAQQKLPVTGVMVENSPDARPQSGLINAGVVFEAIAEGGITRFLALFQENQAPNVGPIRSSRPYYLQWDMGFDAPYAHVGGSPDALADIKSWGVKDLDQFYNGGSYHRISTRYAPHNVYTSIATLVSLEQGKGWTSSTFTGFARKAEAPSKTPNPTSIDFAISGTYYNVHYDYDAATNTYKRSEGGAPHKDADSGQQLAPKVVIALVMPYSLMSDGYHSQYQTIGSGKMYVFQDGTLTTGTWSKADNASQFVFKNDAGQVLELNPGQTWITALGSESNVTYK